MNKLTTLSALILAIASVLSATPPLPPGLGGGPALPAGLGGERQQEVAAAASAEDAASRAAAVVDWLNLRGFAKVRYGTRVRTAIEQEKTSLGEGRLQLTASPHVGDIRTRLTMDLLADAVSDQDSFDLRRGQGALDLREAWIYWRASSAFDMRVGRQTSTWGTGDLVFINDLFPKDYKSFFIGRDEEYLKAPGDALRTGFYSAVVNLDVVVTPLFNPDRFIDGERLSYWNPAIGEIAGENAIADPRLPNDPEVALRLYRMLGAFEVAAYGYSGFWKSPAGARADGEPFFPRLNVYGSSLRGPMAGGIANAEFGWYDSRAEGASANPLLPNSERRYLLGYDRELLPQFNAGLQWYVEETVSFGQYESNAIPGALQRDRFRHWMTLRLTRLAMQQNLELSLFTFWGVNQNDLYFRPRASYRWDDYWTMSAGANIFAGRDDNTFWGQFQSNSNVWFALRRSF